ncbi:Scr1 family TA system antitoxin-like transcriptional regulator [Streptomyces sp. NPDC006996]|uniref:Scr1 family TA system antitoxin-like transcriptional regulator n=1 Tax=Streptomyces sp. NPDC006996 TaxID=3156908 RepID=UPI0033C8BADF
MHTVSRARCTEVVPSWQRALHWSGIRGNACLEGKHHVREYTRAFDGLRAAALSPQHSVQLIKSVVKKYSE